MLNSGRDGGQQHPSPLKTAGYLPPAAHGRQPSLPPALATAPTYTKSLRPEQHQVAADGANGSMQEKRDQASQEFRCQRLLRGI
jgi:hypothetical protein